MFPRKLRYIPQFTPVHKLVPGLERSGRPRPELVTVTNPTWSGAVVDTTQGQLFN